MKEAGIIAEKRPSKRQKNAIFRDGGPYLKANALLKYALKLPQRFTPGAVQANRLALRVRQLQNNHSFILLRDCVQHLT